MYPTSTAFQTALLSSHTAIFKAEVLRDGTVIDTITSNLVGGKVVVDTTAGVQRSATVQFADATGDLVPLLATDPLTPYGNELRLWRGVALSTGDEWVPLITGGIFDTITEESGSGITITCDIYDRSRLITLNPFVDVYQVGAGTNVATAVKALIADRLPDQLYASMAHSYTSTGATAPGGVFGGTGANDPWQIARDLAAAAGLDVTFDPLGNDILIPIPNPLTVVPVAVVAEGSNLIRAKRRLTAEATFNGAIVEGQNTANKTPVRAVAWDTDTSSPTYYLGPFGKRPTFLTSPLVNSAASGQDAADALLAKNLGGTELVTFGTIVNPSLAGYDVVLVEADAAGVPSTRYVLQSFTVPLDVDTALDAVCRVRRVVA